MLSPRTLLFLILPSLLSTTSATPTPVLGQLTRFQQAASRSQTDTQAHAHALSPRQSSTSTTYTYNQLTDGTACKAITLIFARGTTEPGNVGISVGPPFISALQSTFGAANVAIQGLTYGADFSTVAGGDQTAGKAMAGFVSSTRQKCPMSKIILGGYSQGAEEVHIAGTSLAASGSEVNAVVMFGDPFNKVAVGQIPASKVKIYCHAGDGVCAGTFAITAQHLNYGADCPAAAAWVKQTLGTTTNSGSSAASGVVSPSGAVETGSLPTLAAGTSASVSAVPAAAVSSVVGVAAAAPSVSSLFF